MDSTDVSIIFPDFIFDVICRLYDTYWMCAFMYVITSCIYFLNFCIVLAFLVVIFYAVNVVVVVVVAVAVVACPSFSSSFVSTQDGLLLSAVLLFLSSLLQVGFLFGVTIRRNSLVGKYLL